MTTLPFDTFWSWVLLHPNCILRAGAADAVVYDDDDLHWHFAADGSVLYVQVIRGKRIQAELVLESERIAYVQDLGEEREGEFVFELISETENDRSALYYFVMAHAYEEAEPTVRSRGAGHTVH